MAIVSAIDEAEGEVTDEMFAAYEQNTADMGAKVDSYCGLISHFEARKVRRELERARLQALAAKDASRAESLRKRLMFCLKASGKTAIETDANEVKVVKNGGSLPLIIDGGLTPQDAGPRFCWRKTSFEIDKGAIREALASGEELAFAKFGERGERLSIS
jgi:hypothetical protein